MPFLAPFAVPLITAGLGIGSSAVASKLSKAKPSSTESNVLNQDAQAQQTSLNSGQNLIGMGTQASQAPMNYWSSILSGNRSAMTGALAPEISRIGQGYQTAEQTSAALSPRGGPSAEFNAELPFAQQHDITSLLQGARPDAAKSLAGQGSNLLSAGTQSLLASTAAGRDILTSEAERKRLEAERGKSIGTGLFDMIQKYGFPAIDSILKRSGTSTVQNLPGSIFTGDIGSSGGGNA